jgi:hypothetical protein
VEAELYALIAANRSKYNRLLAASLYPKDEKQFSDTYFGELL